MASDDTTDLDGPESHNEEILSDEEAKRQAMRKRKPLGEVVKPLTKAQIDALLGDPEVKERDNLADALPKGWDQDYQDEF